MPTHVVVFFAQDQWRAGNVTANLGARYDLEMTPLNNDSNRLFASGEYAVDRNNIAPRIGLTWNPRGSSRSIVRGGYGILYDKVTLQTTTPFVSTGIYSSSFTVNFPNDRIDPGPRAGQFPTDLMLVNGPLVNRALLDARYPLGSIARNTGIVYLDKPDRVVPATHQVTAGYERQLAREMAATVDYVHSWNRDQLMNFDLDPGVRVNTTASGLINYTDLYGIAKQLGIAAFGN